jgi:D-3-phosphoglycerate dehydrogenase
MSHSVFIASSTFGENSWQLIADQGITVRRNATGKRLNAKDLIEQAAGAEAVIAGLEVYDAAVLSALPQLKCISRCGVGLDNVDMSAAARQGISVFNTPDVVTQPVAEMTVAMIFDLLKGLTVSTELMRQRKWERRTALELRGRKVGVIGLGRIGRRVAELLKRLEADVYGYDIAPDVSWAGRVGVSLAGINDLWTQMDVLTLHLSVTAEHPFILGTREISLMKPGTLIVNAARGALIDETALHQALLAGRLGGAALDVYGQEPYAGPLCDLENVILTPHIATLTHESRAAMECQAAANVLRFFGVAG